MYQVGPPSENKRSPKSNLEHAPARMPDHSRAARLLSPLLPPAHHLTLSSFWFPTQILVLGHLHKAQRCRCFSYSTGLAVPLVWISPCPFHSALFCAKSNPLPARKALLPNLHQWDFSSGSLSSSRERLSTLPQKNREQQLRPATCPPKNISIRARLRATRNSKVILPKAATHNILNR